VKLIYRFFLAPKVKMGQDANINKTIICTDGLCAFKNKHDEVLNDSEYLKDLIISNEIVIGLLIVLIFF
jgi:hypothetical protein